MKVLVVVFFVLVLNGCAVRRQFVSQETQGRILKYTGKEAVVLPKCDPLKTIPVDATFSSSGRVKTANLWMRAKDSWLFTKDAATAINAALDYVGKLTLLQTTKKDESLLVRVPCVQE